MDLRAGEEAAEEEEDNDKEDEDGTGIDDGLVVEERVEDSAVVNADFFRILINLCRRSLVSTPVPAMERRTRAVCGLLLLLPPPFSLSSAALRAAIRARTRSAARARAIFAFSDSFPRSALPCRSLVLLLLE